MSGHESIAISTVGLSKTFGDRPALGPLDLEVGRGQRVALVGHNGSGKTTLARLLSGLLMPTAGKVAVAGHDAGTIEARAALSYLSDTPVFYDDLSVHEHLSFISRLHGVTGGTGTSDTGRADDLLLRLGIADRADDLPSTFSRGLKQKAAIAIAFVRPFEVLVVDEPFVGLDRQGRDALLGLLREAHGGGATLLVASHEVNTLQDAERLVALRDGQLAYDGTVADADLDELFVH